MLPFRYKHFRQKIIVLRASFEYKRGNFSFSSSSQWLACSPEMGAPVALLNWDSWEMLLTSITGKSFGCFPQSAKLDEWTVSMKQLLWLSIIVLKKLLPIAFPQRDQNFQISVRSWYYTFLQGSSICMRLHLNLAADEATSISSALFTFILKSVVISFRLPAAVVLRTTFIP